MKGLWIIGLVPLLLTGCKSDSAGGDTAKATDTPAKDAKAPAAGDTGQISIKGEKPTFAAVTGILNKRCTSCHGGNGRSAAGYDLTSYDSVMKGGRGGADVIVGDDANSPIVMYVTGQKSPRMPKGGAPLDPADIDLIKAWIKAGAKNE